MFALKIESIPSIAVHPGFVLKEELESRNITHRRFAEVIGVPYTQLNEILNEKRPRSADFALAVEAALGIKNLYLAKTPGRLQFAKRLPEPDNQKTHGEHL